MFNVKFNYSLLAPKSQEMANNKNTNSPFSPLLLKPKITKAPWASFVIHGTLLSQATTQATKSALDRHRWL